MAPRKTTSGSPVDIRIDRELTHPQVIALLQEHMAGMHAESPPESVHALDVSALRDPAITFWTAWKPADPASDIGGGDAEEEQLLACGALKELDATHGEIKSMRTSARHLRQGAARAILTEILATARQRGYARVSLETGSTPGFEPAIAMYRQFGFVECGPFADYREDPFSRFMTTALERRQT